MGRQAFKVQVQFPGCTTHDILKNHTNVFDKGIQYTFIERNASIELQKAFSIVIMSTEITSLNGSICDASEKASNVTGYSSYKIPKLDADLFSLMLNLLSNSKDDATDTA